MPELFEVFCFALWVKCLLDKGLQQFHPMHCFIVIVVFELFGNPPASPCCREDGPFHPATNNFGFSFFGCKAVECKPQRTQPYA